MKPYKKKTTELKKLLNQGNLSFLMEAHNGLSAKIVEESGFAGIWGSGLSLSAAMGVRDNNEASWTQILETVEFMSDATSIPILLDGDTGYGDFNTVRRLIRKLESRGIAGVCIEDKIFPKQNSFIDGDRQEMAPLDEFCGKIKAAKDSQSDNDFCVVARIESFILGWGLKEALNRAEAYHAAGADAVLIHSKKSRPDEIVSFMSRWDGRCPVVIVPTKYYSTPTELFEEIGISVVIWANQLLRSAVTHMQNTALTIHSKRSLVDVEDGIASVSEIFRLQGAEELQEAEKRYLPKRSNPVGALILAASRGIELGELTKATPKAMITIAGKPLLHRMIDIFNDMGIRDITVVRGYQKNKISALGLKVIDNDEYENSREVYSLYKSLDALSGPTLITFGDILFKKFILQALLEEGDDITLIVDVDYAERRRKGRYGDYVICDNPYDKTTLDNKAAVVSMGNNLQDKEINGEWIGLCYVTSHGAEIVRETVNRLTTNPDFKRLRMADLFTEILKNGHRLSTVYITGHWLDIDDMGDYEEATVF